MEIIKLDEFEQKLSGSLGIKVRVSFSDAASRLELAMPFLHRDKRSVMTFLLKTEDALPIILDESAYDNYIEYVRSKLAAAPICKTNSDFDNDQDSFPF